MKTAKPLVTDSEQVNRILAGTQTQIRYPIEPQPTHKAKWDSYLSELIEGDTWSSLTPHKPHYAVGDLLFVQEPWAFISDWTDVDPEVEKYDGFIYKAKWGGDEHPEWRDARFMPREAARVYVKVTGVRAERLQEISIADCVLDGIPEVYGMRSEIKNWFIEDWDATHKESGFGWDINPWVWCCEFELVTSDMEGTL
jgi:hypothetical protein